MMLLMLVLSACSLDQIPVASPNPPPKQYPLPLINLKPDPNIAGLVIGHFPPFQMDLRASGSICLWLKLDDVWKPQQNPPAWSDLPSVLIRLNEKPMTIEEASYTSSVPKRDNQRTIIKYPGMSNYCFSPDLSKGEHVISVQVSSEPGIVTIYSWRFMY
jgi:hypothetical protein